LFDYDFIFSAGVQLPYPGDFASFAKDGKDSVAIQGIESSQYRYPPDEGFEDFVPSTSTGNNFELIPSSTLPSSTSTAALGLAGQELLNPAPSDMDWQNDLRSM
jgi:hypothetical protein